MTAPRVYFIDDLCRELRVSRRVLQNLRRHRAFPVPELPSLDKRPRWSAAAVDAFLNSHTDQPAPLRVIRPRSKVSR